MNIEDTKRKLIKLINKINSELEDPFLKFHQQKVVKAHMAIIGGNGTLWIDPRKKGYDIGLSGKFLENEMYDFMVNLCGSNHRGYKLTKRLPFWRVDDFYDVEMAAYRYTDLSKKHIFPDEIGEKEKHIEGASQRVYVNAYERNQRARRKCKEHHGLNCKVCNFNFEDTYGSIGQNFIHVHHVKPLSEIQGVYEVDPINDLIPVCPNCHAMLHSSKPTLSVEQLQPKINKKYDHIDFLRDPIKESTPGWLRKVAQQGNDQPLPLKDILTDSVYYPGCGLDFNSIANFRGIHSFIYVDVMVDYDSVIRCENERWPIRFKTMVIRDVDMTEIIKPDWNPPYGRDDTHNHPFCVWLLGEPQYATNESEMVSILYIGGDAAEIYQALYYANGIVPKVLGVIFPGFSSGAFSEGSLFRQIVRQHPGGMPPFLITTYDEVERHPWNEYSENMVSLDDPYDWRLGRLAIKKGVFKGKTKINDSREI